MLNEVPLCHANPRQTAMFKITVMSFLHLRTQYRNTLQASEHCPYKIVYLSHQSIKCVAYSLKKKIYRKKFCFPYKNAEILSRYTFRDVKLTV